MNIFEKSISRAMKRSAKRSEWCSNRCLICKVMSGSSHPHYLYPHTLNPPLTPSLLLSPSPPLTTCSHALTHTLTHTPSYSPKHPHTHDHSSLSLPPHPFPLLTPTLTPPSTPPSSLSSQTASPLPPPSHPSPHLLSPLPTFPSPFLHPHSPLNPPLFLSPQLTNGKPTPAPAQGGAAAGTSTGWHPPLPPALAGR